VTTPADAVDGVASRPASAVRSWLAPPFTIVLFLMHPVTMLLRPGSQLGDPGIGWHLVTGRYIVEHGVVPDHEMFSFTIPGHPEVNFYWLFEALGALLVKAGGLPLYTVACMLVYAAIPVLLYRRMLRIGAGLVPAFLLTVVAYTVLLSHALARPHILSYLFFAVLIDVLDQYESGHRSARSLWWVPLLLMVWTNVHGGFVVGLGTLAVFAAVAAGHGVVTGDVAERRRAGVYGTLFVLALAATLINPRAWTLHVEVLGYLRMVSPKFFQEFRSPNFQSGGAAVQAFELLVLSLIVVLARGGRRLAWIECVLLVGLLHASLGSIRYMNLFAIVAAPIVAREVTPLCDAAWPRFQARMRRIAAEQAALRSPWLYFPAVSLVLVLLAATGRAGLPRNFDDLQLSRGAAEFIAAHPDRFARAFNTDNVGGALIYRFWPSMKVFVDDRVQVYGDDFIMNKYLAVLQLHPNWQAVLDEYGVTAAVVGGPRTRLATMLRAVPGWTVAYEDDRTAIFFRAGDRAPSPG